MKKNIIFFLLKQSRQAVWVLQATIPDQTHPGVDPGSLGNERDCFFCNITAAAEIWRTVNLQGGRGYA